MVARSLARSRTVPVKCLGGEGRVEGGDVGVGTVLYRSGVVQLDEDVVQ